MDALQQLKLPHNCFYVLESTGELVCIVNGQKGYFQSTWSTDDTARNKEIAAYMNERLGLTPIQVEAMFYGSMFGWDSKLADPVYLMAQEARMRAPSYCLSDEEILIEAQRIYIQMCSFTEPNSPNGTHFMVQLSPDFMMLAFSGATEKLMDHLPWPSLYLSGLNGEKGVYAFIRKDEDRTLPMKDKPTLADRIRAADDRKNTVPPASEHEATR